MSHEERNTFAALFTSIFSLLYFGSSLRSDWRAGAFDGVDGTATWAQTVLWFIPICIVLTIVATIAVNILHAIATNTPNPNMITDERDSAIGKRGSLVTMVVASFGFIGALFAMAFGWSTIAGLSLILFGFWAADFVGNLSKIAAYRFGI
jgi:hypothetical protein